MFKTLLLISIFVQLFAIPKKDIKIIKAVKQEWIAGRKESSKGVKYEITLVPLKSSNRLKFEKFWVNGILTNFKIHNPRTRKFGNTFFKNDTLILYSSYSSSFNPGKNEKLPDELNEEVVIEYKINKRKNRFCTVETFSIVKPVQFK